jgi:hypothetical protein
MDDDILAALKTVIDPELGGRNAWVDQRSGSNERRRMVACFSCSHRRRRTSRTQSCTFTAALESADFFVRGLATHHRW